MLSSTAGDYLWLEAWLKDSIYPPVESSGAKGTDTKWFNHIFLISTLWSFREWCTNKKNLNTAQNATQQISCKMCTISIPTAASLLKVREGGEDIGRAFSRLEIVQRWDDWLSKIELASLSSLEWQHQPLDPDTDQLLEHWLQYWDPPFCGVQYGTRILAVGSFTVRFNYVVWRRIWSNTTRSENEHWNRYETFDSSGETVIKIEPNEDLDVCLISGL